MDKFTKLLPESLSRNVLFLASKETAFKPDTTSRTRAIAFSILISGGLLSCFFFGKWWKTIVTAGARLFMHSSDKGVLIYTRGEIIICFSKVVFIAPGSGRAHEQKYCVCYTFNWRHLKLWRHLNDCLKAFKNIFIWMSIKSSVSKLNRVNKNNSL